MPRSIRATGGAFAIALPTVRTLTSAPEGGWVEIAQPQVVTYNGKTYIGWVNGSNGDVKIASWDHETATLSTPFVLHAALGGEGTADNHDSPSILVRSSDRRLVVTYCKHADNTIRQRISTNPEDATAFASEVSLDSQLGGTTYDYPTMIEMADGVLWMLYRDIQPSSRGMIAYSKSADQAATWSAQTTIYGPGVNSTTPYWRIGSDGSSRIDVFVVNKAPGVANRLGHFYLDTAGGRHKSDASVISAALPLVHADITEIADGTTRSIQTWGHAYVGGRPACLYLTHTSAGGGDNDVYVATWSGSAWSSIQVVSSVGGQLGINQYGSGAAMDVRNPGLVWIPVKVSGKFEIYRYRDLAGWVGEALTSSSAKDNVWTAPVYDSDGNLRVAWLYGDYTNDTTYSFGIRAA